MSIYPGPSQIYTPHSAVHLHYPLFYVFLPVAQSVSMISSSLYAPHQIHLAQTNGNGSE